MTYLSEKAAWGIAFSNGMGNAHNFRTHPGQYIAREVQRVGQEGALAAIGRKNGTGVHESIPSIYWFAAMLDTGSVLGGGPFESSGRTIPIGSE